MSSTCITPPPGQGQSKYDKMSKENLVGSPSMPFEWRRWRVEGGGKYARDIWYTTLQIMPESCQSLNAWGRGGGLPPAIGRNFTIQTTTRHPVFALGEE